MYDNEFKTKDNKIQNKTSIEPQHIESCTNYLFISKIATKIATYMYLQNLQHWNGINAKYFNFTYI